MSTHINFFLRFVFFPQCLAIDPKFVKAYIRKGNIQKFLKQYHKALSTFDQALEVEPGNQEVLEAKRATLIAIQNSEGDPERAKEAMKDPEIQAILRDPTISKVLQDMQTSPQAGQASVDTNRTYRWTPYQARRTINPNTHHLFFSVSSPLLSAMRDPDIRKKIEKLIAAGVLSVK